MHWKRSWCWERLKVGGKGDDRESDGWMSSPIRWTWVWAIPGVGDGQGSLVCCSPWSHKESDRTEPLNWTDMLHHCKTPHLNIFESQYCHLYSGDCKTYFTELFIVFWECAQSHFPVVGTQLLVTLISITERHSKSEEGSPAFIQLIKATSNFLLHHA